ncbi:MAG: small basic protein [Candidatus Omnitrophica bacterium]|nr:small basic protein [Candidatus Omnitrophota bacterium]
MGQHSSLKASKGARLGRSVLKRFERIEKMQEKDEWTEGRSIYALPKVKMIKIKVTKKKAGPPTGEEGAEGSASTDKSKT